MSGVYVRVVPRPVGPKKPVACDSSTITRALSRQRGGQVRKDLQVPSHIRRGCSQLMVRYIVLVGKGADLVQGRHVTIHAEGACKGSMTAGKLKVERGRIRSEYEPSVAIMRTLAPSPSAFLSCSSRSAMSKCL